MLKEISYLKEMSLTYCRSRLGKK